MIQVINRAFDILEYVATDPTRPKTLGEVADAIGLNHGTCANIMKTMVARRYLDQVGTKKGYCLGAKAYLLTGNTSYRKDILEAAQPEMARLTQEINESCLLAVLNGDQRILIHRESCDQYLQVQAAPEKHVYDSASGRLLVAMMGDAELERFIARYGLPSAEIWPEATYLQAFMHEINAIRSRGYAFQESVRHFVGYAVAVRRYGEVVASLSIYMPSYRHESTTAPNVLQALTQTADTINQRLK
jgi:DNA-binding IclR family transcriptional regulator